MSSSLPLAGSLTAALASPLPARAGLPPSAWKIRAQPLQTTPLPVGPQAPTGTQTVVIRSLDLSQFSPASAAVRSAASASEAPQLSRDYLLGALDRALTRLSTSLHHVPPLQEAAQKLRIVHLEALAISTPETVAALLRACSQSVRERLLARMENSLQCLEEKLVHQDSLHLRRIHTLLSEGLQQLQRAATSPGQVSVQQQHQGLLALAVSHALGSLYENRTPTEQNLRLQQWAIFLEGDRELSPRRLLAAAEALQGHVSLMAEMQHSLILLAAPGQAEPDLALLDTPLPAASLEVLTLLRDMPADELAVLGEAMQELRSAVCTQWLDGLGSIPRHHSLALQILSSEAQALIQQADELALRVLAPVPEPPQGFEDGVLSLIRKFKQILRQLDQDLHQIFLQILSQNLAQRRLDATFFEKLLEESRFAAHLRTLRDDLRRQLEYRYQQIEIQLWDAFSGQTD